MASPRRRLGPFNPQTGSSKFLTPSEIGGRISNFVLTPEGSLRGIQGACPYMPGYGVAGGAPLSSDTAAAIGGSPAALTYGRMHGICHTVLASGRDVLLIQTGAEIWEHRGWTRTWHCLVGPAASSPQFEMELSDNTRPRWPTQFVTTPTGIVILPYEGRPLFYDGEVIATLGFQEIPGAPDLRGPRSPLARATGPTSGPTVTQPHVNTIGYAHDGNPKYPWDDTEDYQTQMYPDFGAGRIGSVKVDELAPPNGHGGALDTGAYCGAIQWVDRWGNLSALSPRSSVVQFAYQSSRRTVGGGGANDNEIEHRPDLLLKQLLWTRVQTGPGVACVGRVLGRSKDMLHSGTLDLFEMPSYAGGGGAGGFATISDNEGGLYADNTPDAWLVKKMVNTTVVPRGRLGALAFGCFWLANVPGSPGGVYFSLPGRYGTFRLGDEVYPDPRAREITGMCAVPGGLLVLTESSAFIIIPADTDTLAFRAMTLSSTIGCAAPDSVRALPDGRVIWLSYDGFYTYDGEGITYVGQDIEREVRTVSRARMVQATAAVDTASGEYRCWIAENGNIENVTAVVYDGEGWRFLDTVDTAAVCMTQDHRRYMLLAGKYGSTRKNGVWVFDHMHGAYSGPTVTCRYETSWIGSGLPDRMSFPQITLQMREYRSGTSSEAVFAYRDWRLSDPLEAESARFYGRPDDDRPPVWGLTLYTDDAVWRRRRPYWAPGNFHLPDAEVAKFFVSSTSRPEILGVMIHVEPKGEVANGSFDRGAGGGRRDAVITNGGPKS